MSSRAVVKVRALSRATAFYEVNWMSKKLSQIAGQILKWNSEVQDLSMKSRELKTKVARVTSIAYMSDL